MLNVLNALAACTACFRMLNAVELFCLMFHFLPVLLNPVSSERNSASIFEMWHALLFPPVPKYVVAYLSLCKIHEFYLPVGCLRFGLECVFHIRSRNHLCGKQDTYVSSSC